MSTSNRLHLRLRGTVDGASRAFSLEPGVHVVGGARACDVHLPVRGVSRRHAELRIDDAGRLSVRDLDSRNGTWVDGKRLEGGRLDGTSHPADAGAELRFGPVRLRLEQIAASDVELAIDLPAPSERPDASARSLRESTHWLSAAEGASSSAAPRGLIAPDGYHLLASPPMRALYRQMAHLLRGKLPVLLVGETGVGKERLAKLLHVSSERSAEPFTAVNCAAIPAELLEAEMFGVEKGAATGVEARPGKFRDAEGGTLFLDEIGEMAPPLQAKLLRALQEDEAQPVGGRPRPVDVRVVAATNAELDERMEDGRFRRDLYYRLAGDVFEVPPLRACVGDIAGLVEHFLLRACAETGKRVRGLTVGALRLLESYEWPGNVRQLENEIRRLVYRAAPGAVLDSEALSKEVRAAKDETAIHEVPSLSDLRAWRAEHAGAEHPPIPLEPIELEPRLRELEETLIREALRRSEGNQSRAAEILGISRNGLAKKMKRLGIG